MDAYIPARNIVRIAENDDIRFIERVRQTEANICCYDGAWEIQTNIQDDFKIWDKGLRGENLTLGVIDGGIEIRHEMFKDPNQSTVQVSTASNKQYSDPGHRKIANYWVHPQGTYGPSLVASVWHGSGVAGIAAGDNSESGNANWQSRADGRGMAPKAKISFVDISRETSAGSIPSTTMPWFGYMFDYDNAHVCSGSWVMTSSNYYHQSCVDADTMMWDNKYHTLIFSNGHGAYSAGSNPANNDGTCGGPGSAKNAIAAGALGSAKFSFGPTRDGRVKPDILAPYYLKTAYAPHWETNGYMVIAAIGGTSSAAPVINGAVNMIRQYFLEGWYPNGTKGSGTAFEPTSALLRAVLFAGAREYTGSKCDFLQEGRNVTNNSQGWGYVYVDGSLYFSGDTKKLLVFEDLTGLNTGGQKTYAFNVTSLSEPVRVVMVYTDYPSEVTSLTTPRLVNNLDLVISTDTGHSYKGNVITGANPSYSTEGGDADALDNEEGCIFPDAAHGLELTKYTITVTAVNIPQGPQPFAIAVTGAVENAETSGGATPSVVITSPDNGSTFMDQQITVAGTALGDAACGAVIQTVEVCVNEGSWQTASGTDNWSIQVDLSAGWNTIKARASDNLGMTGYSLPISAEYYIEDITPPTVTITSPEDQATVNMQNVSIQGTADDPGSPASGIAKVEVRVNGGTWLQASGTTAWARVITLPEGWNIIQARSTDAKGLVSEIVSINVEYDYQAVDTTAPYVSISYPADGATVTEQNITVSGIAFDQGSPISGVAQVGMRLNSNPWEIAAGLNPWTKNAMLIEGWNTIQVKAVDNAGLESIVVTGSVLYSPQPDQPIPITLKKDNKGVCGMVYVPNDENYYRHVAGFIMPFILLLLMLIMLQKRHTDLSRLIQSVIRNRMEGKMQLVRTRYRFWMPVIIAFALCMSQMGCGGKKATDKIEYLYTGTGTTIPTGTGSVNHPPTVQVQTPSGTVSDIVPISVSVFDQDNDDVTLMLLFSTNGGATFNNGTIVGGNPTVPSVPPTGLVGNVYWNSRADGVGLTSPCSTVLVRIRPSDESDGVSDTTGIFAVDNTAPNTPPSLVLTTPSGSQSGDIGIDFTISDNEGNPSYVTVEYSTDSGGSYRPASAVPGTELGLISTSSSGIPYTFTWDSFKDKVGLLDSAQVIIRMTPEDSATGQSKTTSQFTVDNTQLVSVPSVTVVTPVGEQSGDISIEYTLYDEDSDPLSIVVEFSENGGTTFSIAKSAGGDGTANLSSSPSGIQHVFVWNSTSDEVGVSSIETDVVVRITPSDSIVTGDPAETGQFTVNNLGYDPGENTVYVDGSYSGQVEDGTQSNPFRTIQAAVNAASSGSRVKIADGTYNETVTMKDGVDLVGNPVEPFNVTIVGQDGDYYIPCLLGEDMGPFSCDIIGLTLTGKGETGSRGIRFHEYTGVIRNCIIYGCYSGAANFEQSNIIMINCTVAYNRSYGVKLYYSTQLYVRNSILAFTTAG
jgi:hypothetical protein